MVQHRKRSRRRMLAHERREEINEAKLQFFVNIAHEIRTPLTLIVGPLKRLMGMDNDRKCEYLYDVMERNVHRITDLVSQLMDIRKIEKGLRSEEHTSELQSLMRISYAVFCLKKKIHHISTQLTQQY